MGTSHGDFNEYPRTPHLFESTMIDENCKERQAFFIQYINARSHVADDSTLCETSSPVAMTLYSALEQLVGRPEPFECSTARELWTDEHISRQMLAYHLNDKVDLSSRNLAFISRSVEWICSQFNVGVGTAIADFGCGPGLYTTRLATKGAEVTGIDFSKRSIAYAEQEANRHGLSIRYITEDYLESQLDERFDLILMIMCDFCVLSPAQRGNLLHTFHHLLNSGGRLLLDVISVSAFDTCQEEMDYDHWPAGGFWSAQPYHVFRNRFMYESEKVSLDKYTIIEADRTRNIYNWTQHFIPESLEAELSNCDLTIDAVYADVAGTPYSASAPEFAVVVRKR